MQEKSGNLSAKFLIFFHNRAAVFVENVQQGRCEGKKKTGRQKRLLLSAGCASADAGGLFDGEGCFIEYIIQIDFQCIFSCLHNRHELDFNTVRSCFCNLNLSIARKNLL